MVFSDINGHIGVTEGPNSRSAIRFSIACLGKELLPKMLTGSLTGSPTGSLEKKVAVFSDANIYTGATEGAGSRSAIRFSIACLVGELLTKSNFSKKFHQVPDGTGENRLKSKNFNGFKDLSETS